MSILHPEQNGGCGPQIRVSDDELFLLSLELQEKYIGPVILQLVRVWGGLSLMFVKYLHSS